MSTSTAIGRLTVLDLIGGPSTLLPDNDLVKDRERAISFFEAGAKRSGFIVLCSSEFEKGLG